ncbi:MAG: hypothetical protein ACRC6R_09475 [Bacteroidales bacterium]
MEREIDLIIDNIDELRALVVAMGEEGSSTGILHRITLDKANKIVKLITNIESNSLKEISSSLSHIEDSLPKKPKLIVPPLEMDNNLVDDNDEIIHVDIPDDSNLVDETKFDDVKIAEPLELNKNLVDDYDEDLIQDYKDEGLDPEIDSANIKPLEEINIKVLGEKVSTSSNVERSMFKKIDDIRELISLNDRFLFLRELFGGNSMLMDQTLDQINSMNSFEECSEMLTNIFDWDTESESTKYFFTLITQRFR